MSDRRALISVDVGGTIGSSAGPSVFSRLVAASPLTARDAERVIRRALHRVPSMTQEVITTLCAELRVAVSEFPTATTAPVLELWPGSREALEALAAMAPVVTLSNVTCLESDLRDLRQKLSPPVSDFFPSFQTGYAKPDPRAFQSVAYRHGIRPHQLLHIGDDWQCDVLGAHDAGAFAIWIARGRAAPGPLPPRATAVEDLAEAAQAVSRLSRGGTP